MKGMTSDKAKFEEYIATLRTKLDGYERILSKQKYLAGDVSLTHFLIFL